MRAAAPEARKTEQPRCIVPGTRLGLGAITGAVRLRRPWYAACSRFLVKRYPQQMGRWSRDCPRHPGTDPQGAVSGGTQTLSDRSITRPEGLIQTMKLASFFFLARVRISLRRERGRSMGVVLRKRFSSRRFLKYWIVIYEHLLGIAICDWGTKADTSTSLRVEKAER